MRSYITTLQHTVSCYKNRFGDIDENEEKPPLESLPLLPNGELPQKKDVPSFWFRPDKTEDPIRFYFRVYKNYLEAGIKLEMSLFRGKNKIDSTLLRMIVAQTHKPINDPELIELINKYNYPRKVFKVGDMVDFPNLFYNPTDE